MIPFYPSQKFLFKRNTIHTGIQLQTLILKLKSIYVRNNFTKFLYLLCVHKGMTKVSSKEDIERESKRVISALYGNVSDFRVNETFQIPEKGPREAWDVQVNFMQDNLKYTVDLEIQEKDGQVTNARLLDTKTPL